MTKPIKPGSPEQYLTELFEKHDRAFLGDELKEKLVKKFGKSDQAARQIVTRFASKGIIQNSKPVSFGKGTYAYYPLNKVITLDDLLGLTRLKRPPLFRLLSAIKKCGGIISYYEALKITSTPLKASRSKTLLLDELLAELKHFGVINIKLDNHKTKYIVATYLDDAIVDSAVARHYALMIVDAMFLYDILASLGKLNLIDNKFNVYRNRKFPSIGARHNNFVWDAFSYTRTTGINTVYGKQKMVSTKQALVVLDVVVSRNYELFDFEGFFARVQVLLNHTRKERKIIPIIVYKDISREALNKARSLGLLTYNMSAFFGNSVYEVINNIVDIKLQEYTEQPMLIDPVQVISDTLELIDITGNGINLQNVTGDFFQSLMYQLFHHLYSGCTIIQSEKLPAMDTIDKKNRSYEYDFVIFSRNTWEIVVVELKGSMKNYTIRKGDYKKKNTLKWFFGRTLPSIMQHYATGAMDRYQVKGCFITTGKFDRDGELYLSELNVSKLKPNALEIGYNGKQVVSLVGYNNLGLLKETLEKYFIKD